MASVEATYVDPSALRALYVSDQRSQAVARWRMRAGGALPITRFGHAELINAIALGQFRGDYDEAKCAGALADIEDDLREGRLRMADLPWRAAMDRAVKLSRAFVPKLGARALDVLHVASALELGARWFVTYDGRQAKLAEACGLKVLQP